MNDVYIKKDDLTQWIAKYFNKDIISIADLISCIEDLDGEIENLSDEIASLKQDIEENYKPISKEEMYGISEDDFI